jgi:hypothetical protein
VVSTGSTDGLGSTDGTADVGQAQRDHISSREGAWHSSHGQLSSVVGSPSLSLAGASTGSKPLVSTLSYWLRRIVKGMALTLGVTTDSAT